MRMIRDTVLGGDPADLCIGVSKERTIFEIATEQAELPQVIGNVFAFIDHGAVRAHDHFCVFVGEALRLLRDGAVTGGSGGSCGFRPACDPAAGFRALCLLVDDALFSQLLERHIPEMQSQDFALARQKVIFDSETIHGAQVKGNYSR